MTEMNTDALTPREECLDLARAAVCWQRDAAYGTPEDNHGLTAAYWSLYTGLAMRAEDVATMMVLFKVARMNGPGVSLDSWVDIAGYAACGYEVSKRANSSTCSSR